MSTRVVPFQALVQIAAAYRDALAQGFPAAYQAGTRGQRSALFAARRSVGIADQRVARDRLDTAAALGLVVPGWPAMDPVATEQIRRRYRLEDADYRAWLADPSGPGPGEARRAARAGEIGGPPIPDIARPPAGFEVTHNSGQYDADGNLTRQFIKTRQAAGETFAPPPAHAIKGVSALLDQNGRVRQQWVKTREGAIGDGLVEALQAAFAGFTGAAPLTPPPPAVAADLHTVYPLADLHLGMYAWGRETGDSYDLPIAIGRARAAFRGLIAQAPPSDSCTLLNLGDLFHANDEKAVTPRSGHRLDVDGRWPKVLQAGADLILEIVDLLLRRHRAVEVVTLPGNHDPDAAAALRVALALFYRGRDRVAVDDGPGLIWYRRHGRCLLGATHGHTIRLERVAGMMAADRPQDWGATLHRSFFTAHVHHERAREDAGVRVESFQTLASRDAYAQGGGWRAGHSVQAVTFHAHHGEVMRHRVNVVAGDARIRMRLPRAA